MSDLNRIVRMVLHERKDIIFSVILGFLAGLAAVALVSASGYLISKAALAPPLSALTIMIALLKVFSITRAASRYGERLLSHRATFNILSHVRVNFYEKLEPLAPNIFQKYRSGDLLARIVGDVESLQNFFLRVFYPPLVLLLVFFATVFFTVFYSIYISLILLIGFALTGLVVPFIFALAQQKHQSVVRESRADLSTEATELLYGYRDLKLYQKLTNKEQQLIATSDAYIAGQKKEGNLAVFNQSINSMVALLVAWSVLAMGSFLVIQGELDGLFLAMLVMIALTAFENATPMALFPMHFEDSRKASNRLYSIVEDEGFKKHEPTQIMELPTNTPPKIELSDVSFSFPGSERKAVQAVNVSFQPGSKTAIVGASGSGKSTIMQLLLNIQKADQGKVFINGLDTKNILEEQVWNIANVVLQENHFFYGTIQDNLKIANGDAADSDLNKALSIVRLDHFSLHDEVLEKGENLSGGEKQRLAIARAILKEGHLWVLDEPTSSVDAVTEKEIFDYLTEKTANDTVVLISHKLTGLNKMDQIIVMEDGKVIEVGSYDELMEKQGHFYQMKKLESELFAS